MRGSRDEGWTPPGLCKDKKKYNITIYKKNELTVIILLCKGSTLSLKKKSGSTPVSVTE